MNPTSNTPRPKTTSRRIWLFRLIALGFPVLLLAALELGLRIAGTGYPTSFFVEHPTKPGYLVDNYKFAWRFFPKGLARAPRPIVVQETKPENLIRICVFGGSAAMGDPEPAYGMPRVIETLLQHRYPEKEFEVINCAVTAINSHVVRDIARDCKRLNADAWVIYLGNNEVHGPFGAGTVFGRSDRSLWMNRLGLGFKRTKIGQLLTSNSGAKGAPKNWGGMQMFLDQTISLSDARLAKVHSDFKVNLTNIVESAGSKTHVVLGTVATNVKDFPPFVSAQVELPANDKEAWNGHLSRGVDLVKSRQYSAALVEFEAAEKLAPARSAELRYRMGQCCWQLRADPGQARKAKAHFELARDLDTLRFRADTIINQTIREVAKTTNATLVDSEFVLVEETGLVGDESMHEHVHLNFAGNYKLGKAFAAKLATHFELEGEPIQDEATRWMTEQECANELGVSPFHARLTLVDVRGRLNSPPFSEQMGHAERDIGLQRQMQLLASRMTPELGQQTIDQYTQLIAKRPNDWLLRQQFALLLDSVGRQTEAAEQFEQIAKAIPHNAEAQFRLGAQYNRLKKRKQAEVALRKAIELRPEFARAYNSLGICLSHQDRVAESYIQFARAVELQPSFAEAYVNWGLVLAAKGEESAAVEKYRLATEADANSLKAHVELGKHYVAGNNLQDAMPHYEAIARMLPNDPGAQLNLGMLYLKFGGHTEQARVQFKRVLELSPGNADATAGLRRLPMMPQEATP